MWYAEGKGHSQLWGLLLGLGSLLGLLILVLFPDRHKDGRPSREWDDEDRPRPCGRRVAGGANLPWRGRDTERSPREDDVSDPPPKPKPWERGNR